jgi:hypothetical protein
MSTWGKVCIDSGVEIFDVFQIIDYRGVHFKWLLAALAYELVPT